LNEKGDHDDEMHLWRKRQNDLAEGNPDRRQRTVRLGLVLRSGPTVVLCRTYAAAKALKRQIDDTGCGGQCTGKHAIFEVGLPRMTLERDYITADLPRRPDGTIGPYCLSYVLDGDAIERLYQAGPLAGQPRDAADNPTP
jgi:hypothetical protein